MIPARLRLALLAVACLALCGCEAAPSRAESIEQFEYRWGSKEGDYRSTDRLSPPPEGRVGKQDLWVRARLPPGASEPHSVIYFADPLGLRRAWVAEHLVYSGEPWPIRALPSGSGGQLLTLHFSSSHTTKISGLSVGEAQALTAETIGREYDQFVIGALLAFVGAILGLASLRRPRVPAYAWFGLFSGALGVVTMAQTTLLSLLLVPSTEFWRVVQSGAIFLYPIGFVRFVETVFGDTPRRLFRKISHGLVAFLLVSLLLDAAAIADIYVIKRFVYPIVLVTIVPIFRMMIPRARSDRNARVFLLAFAVLFVIGLPDMLVGMGYPILPFHTAHWGILVFTVGLGLVVEGRVRDQQRGLESASRELSRRLEELRLLNDELRRQIAERSRELATALAGASELAAPAARIEAGQIFDGRYRVLRRLGEGGMGAVYEAARLSDDRRLALKVMTGQATPNAAARFAREAEIAARIDHPNLVSVLDVGVAEGALYFAMELVHGGSLEDHRARFGDPVWAIPILAQVADALRALHANGVVHRDLKPANVLLVERGGENPSVKVADFGISRFGEPTEQELAAPSARTPTAPAAPIPIAGVARLTVTGSMMGTPQYMAPELALGAELARAPADVFAFGVLAVELLTATHPFASPPVYSALYRKALPEAEIHAPEGVDPPLIELVRACLAEAPERRPAITVVLAHLRAVARQ